MADDPIETLEEMKARAAQLLATIAQGEAEAAIPVLPLDDAKAQLATAEEALEYAERPFWDVEHTQIARNQIDTEIGDLQRQAEKATTDGLKAALQEEIAAKEASKPAADKALADAQQALVDHPVPKEAVDVAAQAVVTLRAAVAKAQETDHAA